MWVKVFKNEPSKICGRQPLKNLKCNAMQIFQRLSFTNFTWCILEYPDPCVPNKMEDVNAKVFNMTKGINESETRAKRISCEQM